MSQREQAAAVGVMHYVLNVLIETGLVKLENFAAAEDKRRTAYVLTPKAITEKSVITARFLKRKLAEFESISEEIETLKCELGGESKMGTNGPNS